ncbi:MAG: DUF5320 domain-containing protein [Eubacteriales bacterium]
MPGRDGTGPLGRGSMTGRGMGICTGMNVTRYVVGLGFGRSRRFDQIHSAGSVNHKEFLPVQKKILQDRINLVNKQLKDIEEYK